MKVIIKNISFKNTNKEGQALLDKNSRPFERCGIQTDQHGTKWLSAVPIYQDSPVKQWKVGEEHEIEVKQNGQYLNFEVPRNRPEFVSKTQFEALEARVEDIETELIRLAGAKVKEVNSEMPDF